MPPVSLPPRFWHLPGSSPLLAVRESFGLCEELGLGNNSRVAAGICGSPMLQAPRSSCSHAPTWDLWHTPRQSLSSQDCTMPTSEVQGGEGVLWKVRYYPRVGSWGLDGGRQGALCRDPPVALHKRTPILLPAPQRSRALHPQLSSV